MGFIVAAAVVLAVLILVGTWKWSGHEHEHVVEAPRRRPTSAIRILDNPDDIREAKARAAARELELHASFLDRMDRYQT